MYGFDILIDDSLKPWLIEVNASPSLISTTEHDKRMKKQLVSDLCDVVMPRGWLSMPDLEGANTCKEKKVGKFELLYDEAKDPLLAKMNRPKSTIKKPMSANNWRVQKFNP